MIWENLIKYTLLGTYSLSTIMTVLNTSSSNARIRRKGYEIKPISETSLAENITYFFKDYGFLFIPIYNIIKSIKNARKKENEIDSERLDNFIIRGKIVDEKETEKPVKKEVVKENKEVKQEKNEPKKSIKPAKNIEEIKVEDMDCYERMKYYKEQYDFHLDLYKRAEETGKSVSILNKIADEMGVFAEKYREAKNEVTILEANGSKKR